MTLSVADNTPAGIYRFAGIVLGVITFSGMLWLPPPEGMSSAAWICAAVVLLMVVWWITEALPVAATALAPIALLPVLKVAPLAAITTHYANPIVFLMLGGLLLGAAMQRCGLHERIALSILRQAGQRADLLIAGVMLATAFLSMWISNTATASLMLPICLSIIALMEAQENCGSKEQRNLHLALLSSVAIACNIGGMATLIGTPPNALLAAYMLETYGYDIGFLRWMSVGVPVALVLLLLAWWTLTRWAFPVTQTSLSGVGILLARERVRLGPLQSGERLYAFLFLLTVLAWLSRPLLDSAFPMLKITDTGIVIAAVLILFWIPTGRRNRYLLDAEALKNLPWSVLLLIGGGLSLGATIQDSGLAQWVGEALMGYTMLPLPLLITMLVLAAMVMSHVMSNTATAAVLVPLVAAFAFELDIEPILVLMPMVLAVSCAFMLPVATPPNAIIYSSGRIPILAMLRAGSAISLVSLPVIAVVAYVLIRLLLG